VRAEVRVRQERFEEAVAVVDEALRAAATRRVPLVPDLHFLRGDALARLARYDEAERAFREEMRIFPRNLQAYTRLAIVLGLQHRTIKEVDALLEQMVAASPGSATFELAAKTLESMGDARGHRPGVGARETRADAAETNISRKIRDLDSRFNQCLERRDVIDG
jgi:Flp pilus assembly protein TadD